jgi:mxaL protein
MKSFRTLKMHRGVVLAGLAALALVTALADPQVRLPRATVDALVVLDITQSMNATDVTLDGKRVSRLDFAKSTLHRVLARLPCGSRIGWGVFTEYRVFVLFTPVEVCSSYDELSSTLERIDNRMAWVGGSEIAKALFGFLGRLERMDPRPSLVFITDGHESPPLNPHMRLTFQGKVGEIPGTLLGVGGDQLVPIPKRDRDGTSLGFWGADEVPQTDLYSSGRPTSVAGESMVDERGNPERPIPPSGTEQLSSLKEAHLRELALETGLGYERLESVEGLYTTLTQPTLARRASVLTRVRIAPTALALLLLCALTSWPLTRVFARKSPRPRSTSVVEATRGASAALPR